MKLRVLPYKTASVSAKKLAEAIGAKRIKLEDSDYRYSDGDLVINWGNGGHRGFPGMLNSPDAVCLSINKRAFFKTLAYRGVARYLPKFWTNGEDIPADQFPVLARTTVEGARGEGAVVANTPDDLPSGAPLVTKLFPKTREYRIHLGRRPNGTVSIIGKLTLLRYNDYEPAVVQNAANGYFHSEQNQQAIPLPVLTAAEAVFQATGLDFCAMDIGYDSTTDTAQVFETNTAPAIEHNTVLEGYKSFFALYSEGAAT